MLFDRFLLEVSINHIYSFSSPLPTLYKTQKDFIKNSSVVGKMETDYN